MRAKFVRAVAILLTLGAPVAGAQPSFDTSRRGAAPLVDTASGRRPLAWNLGPQLLPLFNALDAGEHGELAIIGDSISFRQNSYNWFLKARFDADFGSGGEGFLSPSGMDGSCEEGFTGVRCGIDLSNSQGAWISTNSGERSWRAFGLDVDGNYGILDVSESGIHGRLSLLFYGDQITLHYVKEPGAGIFQVFLNGDPIAMYDASTTGDPEHASLTFATGSPGPEHLTSFVVKHISGGQVFVDGFRMMYDEPGFVYHRLARGGAGPSNFLNGAGPPTTAFLAELDPQLFIVMLDWAGIEQIDDYVDNMNALMDYYEASAPGSKFVLVTHHAFKESIALEADWLYEIARARGHGYINLYDLHEGFEELNALGFLEDEVHFTAAGGQWFGDYIYELLRDVGRAATTADHDGNGVMDVNDALAFITDFAAGDGDADLDADGSIDARDVAAYLGAYARATR